MKPPRQPVFVGRGTYRRRRLVDLAMMLPFIGVALIFMPVIWGPEPLPALLPTDPAAQVPGPEPVAVPQGGGEIVRDSVFLFAVWLGLVVAAFAIARSLRGTSEPEDADGGSRGGTR